MGTRPSFVAYHKRVWLQIFADVWKDAKDIRELRSTLVLVIGALLATILAARLGIVRPAQTVAQGLVNSSFIWVAIAFYVIYHGSRSPWRVDLRRHAEITKLQSDLAVAEGEAQRHKPKLCLGVANVTPIGVAGMGQLQVVAIANSNSCSYNHAHGVHGTLEFRGETVNPVIVDLGWINSGEGLGRPEPPIESVTIQGGHSWYFVWSVEIEGCLWIPKTGAQYFERGAKLLGGRQAVTAHIEGTNCDPIVVELNIAIDPHGWRHINVGGRQQGWAMRQPPLD